MDKQNIYPGGYDDTVIETTANYTTMPRSLSWTAKYELNRMLDNAMYDAAQDKLSAQLARKSMENIGVLATTAETLSNMNPDATRCYAAIINVYTKNSLARLKRW